jgi:hypothetical protein
VLLLHPSLDDIIDALRVSSGEGDKDEYNGKQVTLGIHE